MYFPLAYEEAIRAQSEKYGIDSYFINSIIRQESLFDRLSLSSAGARGLMQIMPGTGKRLHETEETRPFEVDSLFQANFNIGLGAKYLNQLKKHYQGNWVHILICYNAGPGVLEKWRKRFNDITDPDTFIESIPYPETRKYVKLVLRNYGIYQILYPRKL